MGILSKIIYTVGGSVGRGKTLKRTLKVILYLTAPVLALCSVWPIISEMPPLRIESSFNVFQFLMVTPWYLGLLCAPLYSYVLLFDVKKDTLSGFKLKLVDYSLKGAIISSILGLEAVLAIIPTPFVVLSIVFSVSVFIEYRKVS